MLPSRVLRAAHGHKRNITGFNMRAFKEAAGQPRYDPWERAEAWRYTGTFSRWNRFKGALPGLGIATVAFTAYVIYEDFYLAQDHAESHSQDEHH